MRGNLPGPEGLARPFARAQQLCHGGSTSPCDGASAALHGLPVVTTTGGAARLASAPRALSNGAGQAQPHRTDIRPCQRGSREILRQAPWAIDVFGGSSSGRTTVSDTVYLGSNPSPPANQGPHRWALPLGDSG